jgi:hypothetical protein
MKKVNSNNWKALFFLSIIIPMGLLTTFKFTGIISQQQIKETINVEPVIWSFARPNRTGQYYVPMNNTITNVWNSDLITIQVDLKMSSYFEDEPTFGDHFFMLLRWQAEAKQGFVNIMTIQFTDIDEKAFLDIDEGDYWLVTQNLRIDSILDSFEIGNPQIIAHGIDGTSNYSLQTALYWMLFDQNRINHKLTITAEAVYFDAVSYRKVALPLQLEVVIE